MKVSFIFLFFSITFNAASLTLPFSRLNTPLKLEQSLNQIMKNRQRIKSNLIKYRKRALREFNEVNDNLDTYFKSSVYLSGLQNYNEDVLEYRLQKIEELEIEFENSPQKYDAILEKLNILIARKLDALAMVKSKKIKSKINAEFDKQIENMCVRNFDLNLSCQIFLDELLFSTEGLKKYLTYPNDKKISLKDLGIIKYENKNCVYEFDILNFDISLSDLKNRDRIKILLSLAKKRSDKKLTVICKQRRRYRLHKKLFKYTPKKNKLVFKVIRNPKVKKVTSSKRKLRTWKKGTYKKIDDFLKFYSKNILEGYSL